MIRSFNFIVPGEPVPCARARVFMQRGKMRAITPTTTRRYQATIAQYALAARPQWWRTDWAQYAVTIDVYRSVRRGDADNIAKSMIDAVQKPRVKKQATPALTKAAREAAKGILWDNDARVTQPTVRLHDVALATDARLVVEATMLGEADVAADRKARAKARRK